MHCNATQGNCLCILKEVGNFPIVCTLEILAFLITLFTALWTCSVSILSFSVYKNYSTTIYSLCLLVLFIAYYAFMCFP